MKPVHPVIPSNEKPLPPGARGDRVDSSPCRWPTLRRSLLAADGPHPQKQLFQRLAVGKGGGLEQAVGAQKLGQRLGTYLLQLSLED